MTLVLIQPDLTAYAAWGEAGIDGSGSIETSGLFADLDMLIGVIMALGGFWILACLIIAGMKLSGSGSNPQKRTEGLIALAFTALGGFIIIKAYDIAGWVNSFGG